MSLLRTARRVAVASAVHGKVQHRQQQRWAAQDQAPAAAPVAAAPVMATDDLITQLERLGQLRDSGVLTEAEFAAQKATLLG
ncbi:MAG TPA: SHOCT domain-containing protein [Mycobacterium sp.]